MRVAMVCVAKNEDHYIREWIDYHKKIGFDDIFIYENDWSSSIVEPNVITIPYNGKCMQIRAYNSFIRKFHKEYDWAAFLDVDEFLVLKKHSDVKSFIKDYQDFPAIGINWIMFGDNGLKEVVDNDYSMIKRFTKRQRVVNPFIKVIIKLDNKVRMKIHSTHSHCVDTKKRMVEGPQNFQGDNKIAQINHYFCKTKPEFLAKRGRGRADILEKRPETDFDKFNFNEVTDMRAYNFMYKNG